MFCQMESTVPMWIWPATTEPCDWCLENTKPTRQVLRAATPQGSLYLAQLHLPQESAEMSSPGRPWKERKQTNPTPAVEYPWRIHHQNTQRANLSVFAWSQYSRKDNASPKGTSGNGSCWRTIRPRSSFHRAFLSVGSFENFRQTRKFWKVQKHPCNPLRRESVNEISRAQTSHICITTTLIQRQTDHILKLQRFCSKLRRKKNRRCEIHRITRMTKKDEPNKHSHLVAKMMVAAIEYQLQPKNRLTMKNVLLCVAFWDRNSKVSCSTSESLTTHTPKPRVQVVVEHYHLRM